MWCIVAYHILFRSKCKDGAVLIRSHVRRFVSQLSVIVNFHHHNAFRFNISLGNVALY